MNERYYPDDRDNGQQQINQNVDLIDLLLAKKDQNFETEKNLTKEATNDGIEIIIALLMSMSAEAYGTRRCATTKSHLFTAEPGPSPRNPISSIKYICRRYLRKPK
jgi:hypothetical protein